MEAKELRIGNYVYPFDDISLVDYKTIFRDFIKVTCKDFENTLSLQAIPITEQWLLKFGFEHGEHREHGYLWLNCDMGEFYVRPSDKGGFYWGFDNGNEINNQNNIKHVNQLQNLYFLLTNQELTIK